MSRLKKIIEHLLYVYVFVLPWRVVYLFQERFLNGAKWEYGSFGLYFTEILLWVIVFLQFLVLFKRKKFFSVPVLLFLIWGFVSIFWAKDGLLAGFYAFHLLEAVLLLFVILTAQFEKRKLIWSLVFSGLIQSCLAVFQFLTQGVFGCKWLGMSAHLPSDLGSSVVQYSEYRWLRSYGSFAHPNALGGFLAVCLLSGLYLYSFLKDNISKFFLCFSVLVVSAGLFFSFSRSAWLGFVIGILVLLFRKIGVIRILIYIFLVFACLSIIYHPLVLSRFSFDDRLEVKSVQERIDSVSQAKEIVRDNLFLGVGLGNYTVSLFEKNPLLPAWEFQPVHNLYLMVWAELGLVGFVLFLFFVLRFLCFCRRHALVCVFACVLVIGFFDHYVFTSYFGIVLFFLILGFCLRDGEK